MVELDYDQVLDELTNFTKKPDAEAFPEVLDRYLESVAKNGDTVFPWSKVKPFIRRKLEIVMDNFNRENPLTEAQLLVPNCKPFDFADLKGEIMKSFDWFYAAPFTVQRLCELLSEPGKHYRRTDKFMRGIEKNVLVVSTVQPRVNKYATAETMEKQANFKEMYPLFSSPQHNNHNSSTSSASSSSSPGMQNGSLENAQPHPNNSYDSPYLNSSPHPLANSFYDHTPPPQLNNHHLLDTMGEGGVMVPPSLQHQHSLAHHPLQQLDSFTNVFATTTTTSHHHLTHLNSAYSLESSSTHQVHLTNGSSVGSWAHEIKTTNNPYDSLLHPAHGDHLNDDNENIIVDDDEEDEKDEDDRRVLLAGAEEKDPYYYTDSSNSSSNNTSDSSSYNSDNSNDKDEPTKDDAEAQQEPNSSSETPGEVVSLLPEGSSPSHDLTPKKRPSPTPPAEPSDTAEGKEAESVSQELESPLTPKKLRVESEEEEEDTSTSTTSTTEEPEESAQIELKEQQVVTDAQVQEGVSSGDSSSVACSLAGTPSVNEEENLSSSSVSNIAQSSSDDSIPMNVDDQQQLQVAQAIVESIAIDPMLTNSSTSNNDLDIPMQSTGEEEQSNSPDDQVMDEPMDQE